MLPWLRKRRESVIEMARPQFEDGESVVAAFFALYTPNEGSIPNWISNTVSVMTGLNVPLVVTDRRVFVFHAKGMGWAKSVESVLPRDQVRVEKVRFLTTLGDRVKAPRAAGKPITQLVQIVLGDRTLILGTPSKPLDQKDDLLALASSFGCSVHV